MNQFNPHDHGIYRRLLLEDGSIDSIAWNRAAEEGAHVGTCRECGFHTVANPTYQAGSITWYSGYCTNAQGCGKEFAAPNGGALKRTSRRQEMPAGFWDARMKALGAS